MNGSSVSVGGAFAYTSASGLVLNAGNGQLENVTFTPADTTDYNSVTTQAIVNVAAPAPVAPDVTLSAVNITYGTALANGQLSGTASYTIGTTVTSIPGAFTFNTAAGQVPSAGQTEAVTFTPTDTTDYTPVALTATVNVAQATPLLTAIPTVSFGYGTPLTNSQLSGSASFIVNGVSTNVQGTFSYTTDNGKVLGAGSGQTEAVTFTPSPTFAVDYSTAPTSVIVNVTRGAPTVTSVNTLNITYGTPLANSMLSGAATYTANGSTIAVPGTFTFTSANGMVLNAGNGLNATVTFTPTDTTDFTTASSSVAVNVATATPTVTVADAGGVASGNPFPASGNVTGVGSANLGTLTFMYYQASDTSFSNPTINAPSALGRYVVVGSYAATGNYNAGAAEAGFVIDNGTPPVNPTVVTAAQPTAATLGASIADKVTVTGSSPTGAVTFRLYNNASATAPALFTDTESLSGGIATSKGFVTTTAALGTDYWVATYSGDASNNPATSVANADPVTVTGSLVVNSTSDSATATGNTLRDAVAYANTLGAGTHAITFDSTVFATAQTITLGGPLTLSDISGATIITGSAAGVTLSGGNTASLFNVKTGVTATLSQLTLINGKSSNGGAIVDQGTLTITNSTLTGNTSTGLGGAIVVTGTLTVQNSTFVSNTAAGSGGAIGGLGADTIQAGNGKNILIDGSVALVSSSDSLSSILQAWISGGSTASNVANIRSRIKVTYNTSNANRLQAGSGLDWFWYTYSKDQVNKKPGDLLN